MWNLYFFSACDDHVALSMHFNQNNLTQKVDNVRDRDVSKCWTQKLQRTERQKTAYNNNTFEQINTIKLNIICSKHTYIDRLPCVCIILSFFFLLRCKQCMQENYHLCGKLAVNAGKALHICTKVCMSTPFAKQKEKMFAKLFSFCCCCFCCLQLSISCWLVVWWIGVDVSRNHTYQPLPLDISYSYRPPDRQTDGRTAG